MRSGSLPRRVGRESNQKISIGVVAGTNLTDDFKAQSRDYEGGGGFVVTGAGSRRLIIGSAVELHLPSSMLCIGRFVRQQRRS